MSGGANKLKVRFTSLDISAIVTELKESLIGLRVSNIYDVNQKTYLFKLSRGEKKEFLLIENGVRVHTTNKQIEQSQNPSGFTMKFRKYLRSKRIQQVDQIGVERVLMLTFGSGELTTHLIMELYSSGNIIMTDKDQQIIQLIRSHTYPDGVKTAINQVYPFDHAANLHIENFIINQQTVLQILEGGQNQDSKTTEVPDTKEEPTDKQKGVKGGKKQDQDDDDEQQAEDPKKQQETQKGGQKEESQQEANKQKDQANALASAAPGIQFREIVFKLVPSLHNPVIDHILKGLKIAPNSQVSEENVPQIIQAATKCLQYLQKFIVQQQKGYLFYTIKAPVNIPKTEIIKKEQIKLEQGTETIKIQQEEIKQSQPPKPAAEPQIKYFEFSPNILSCHEGKQYQEFSTYNEAVDVFFQVVQKDEDPETQKERIAWRKFQNIKQDQDNRIKKLRDYQEECAYQASLIEQNIQEVEAVSQILSTICQSGQSWDQITKMINESKKLGDPLANLIMSMDLPNNNVTLFLSDPDQQDTDELTPVQIDFLDSAYVNATNYYNLRKKNVQKEHNTVDALQKALQKAETQAIKDMEKIKSRPDVFNARKTFWFEKFYWFITSENYLVISGRDFHQNEAIVKKYLRKGDIYMHADYHGAASTIIKNPNKDEDIPQNSLNEAAIATICRSKAWDAQIFAAAWWVRDHQVSKKAETGQFLPTGSFMIRGKQNFIHPSMMEMGATLLFRIDVESLNRHKDDRKVHVNDPDYISRATSGTGDLISNQLQEDQEFAADLPEFKKQESLVDELMLNKSDSMKQEEDKMVTIVGLAAPIIGIQKNEAPLKQGMTQDERNRKQGEMRKQQEIQSLITKEEQEQLNSGQSQGKSQQVQGQNNTQKVVNNTEKDEEEDGDDGGFDQYGKSQNKQKDTQQQLNQQQQVAGDGKTAVNQHQLKQLKKIQDQYGDQDDEEREMKLQLIGSKMVQGAELIKPEPGFTKLEKDSDSESESDSEQENENENKTEAETEAGTENIIQSNQQKGNNVKEDEKENTEVLVEKPEITKQEEIKQEQTANETKEQLGEDDMKVDGIDSDQEQEKRLEQLEEQRIAAAEKEVEEAPEIIQSELMELNRLVTYTFSQDTYQFLVFMCCPYLTLQNQNCQFKIKLSPGNTKQGKAARSVIQYFGTLQDTNNNEQQLLKSMAEQEVINGIIGNCQLSGTGMLKLKEKEQIAQRQSKKDTEKQPEKHQN